MDYNRKSPKKELRVYPPEDEFGYKICLSEDETHLIRIPKGKVHKLPEIPKAKGVVDRESKDVLLQIIIDKNQKEWTFSELAKAMRDYGFKSYEWQTARVDLKKLGIIKWTDRKKKPIIIYMDLDKAKAKQLANKN